MKNILDSRKIIDTKSRESLVKQIEAQVKGNNDRVLEALLASLASLDCSLLNQVSKIWNLAVEPRRAEALEVLLENTEFKKNINVKNSTGLTPLIFAAYKGYTDAVTRLIEAGADITSQITGSSDGWDGATVLHIAVFYDKIEVLKLLLRHQDIREVLSLPDKDGYTPLMDAAGEGHADVVSRLIEAGADITARITGNSDGWDGATALHIAAFYNKIEVLKLLLKHKDIKKVLNLPNKNGFTPLMDAAMEGHSNVVSRLIKAGANITIQVTGSSDGWDGYTALYIAVSLNKIEVLKLLLRHEDMKKILNLPHKGGYTPLMDAAYKGHVDAVSRLIEAGVDITNQVAGSCSNGWAGATALYMAASKNKIGILKLLLKHKDIKKVLNLPNKNGFTPLMYAAMEGHSNAVSQLIEAGANITSQIAGNFDGWDRATALHIAVFYNKIEVLKLLLKHEDIKKVLNLPDKNGFTPLMDAAMEGHSNVVSRLIKVGADITVQIRGNSDGWDGATALHIAVFYDKIEVLRLLLKHKDIREVLNLPSKDGLTPLMRAASKGHTDTVGKLIETSADITAQITGNSKGWDGATVLHIAVFYDKIEVLELLLKHQDMKKVLNLPNKNGFTPLIYAAMKGHADAVNRLIKVGADITVQIRGNSDGWNGVTALYIAASLNKIGILELLLKHKDIKKVLNLPNKNGFTPLMDAASKGYADTVGKLIEAGADITIQVTGNSNVRNGSTALHIAASLNKIEVLELLLKHKDVKKVLNLPKEDGYTPLMCAAKEGHADAVSKLIEAGADITAQITGNSNGWDGATTLHIAVFYNKMEVLKLLLKHKDIREVLNLPSKDGLTPLICAAMEGHTDTVSRLIKVGADITVQIRGNSDGWDGATVLHIAVSLNKTEVLKLLLKHQDIREVLNLPGKNGLTPLMRAASKGHADTVGKLIESGADIAVQITRNSKGWNGYTALHIAASKNKIEVLKLLLKHQDIREVLNLPSKDGLTSLMRAASKGHVDVVSRLIEAGADITVQNHNKNTAAHLAAKYQKGKSLGMLIDKAPKVLEMLNETGHTPGELLNSRQKRSSSEVSIFSNGAEGGGKQKRRRIQTNSGNR